MSRLSEDELSSLGRVKKGPLPDGRTKLRRERTKERPRRTVDAETVPAAEFFGLVVDWRSLAR
jgi:hypothetical protein